jgi:predicted Zn-ribbon and HTH transcriptional regulator
MDTYTVEAKCENCGFVGEVRIIKGFTVDNKKCPKCDCKHLRRNKKKSEYSN